MNCRYFTVVLSCLLVKVSSQKETYDYCDPKLKLCEEFMDHTMCKYGPGLSSQCTVDVHEPLSAFEKDRILMWHNKFRSIVANGTEKNRNKKLPTASNMRQMYWDNELETIAARWAEQCTSTKNPNVYDKCRNTKRFQVSQNVGTRLVNGSTTDKQAPQIVITWYKESKDFEPNLVDRFVPTDSEKVSVRQFANIIWADTYALGCARIVFQEKLPITDRETRLTIWTIERLVCNYGPGGNEIGKQIYKRGAPCGSCPVGTECSRSTPGLCAIQNLDVSGGGRDEQTTKEKETTSTQEIFTEPPVTKEEKEEERTDEEDVCEGEDCSKTTSTSPRYRVNDLLRFSKPTARKKSREAELAAPSQLEDSYVENWKVTESKKVRRDDSGLNLKNGDKCKCFHPVNEEEEEEGSGSCIQRNFFLLLLSSFVAVGADPFSTSYYKQ